MKKMMAFVLMLVLMMTAAVAETATPSVKVEDITKPVVSIVVTPTDAVQDVESAETFVIYTTEVSEKAQEVFAEIAAAATESTVSTYFKEEVLAETMAYLPEDTDMSTLVLDEFIPVGVLNYDEEIGDAEAEFEFVTHYEDGTVLVAMIGFVNPNAAEGEDEIIWVPVQAMAQDGKVKIQFTQEVLLKIEDYVAQQDTEVVMALLRAE